MPTTDPRPRILLVDDNVDNLALMRLFLGNGPYQIDSAENGREAVDKFTAAPYDLVFMDLEMPVLDGYEATRAMRAVEKHRPRPPVPILALTAHALDECRLRCEEVGCSAFLVKPVGKATVLDTVGRFLDRTMAPVKEPASPQNLSDREFLRPLLPLFFATADETLKTARQALEDGALLTVRAQGHKLKGSALSYGFEELGQAARAMELAGGQGDWATAAVSLELAEALLARARQEAAH